MRHLGLFLWHIVANLLAPATMTIHGSTLPREQYGAQSPGSGDARQKQRQHGLHDHGAAATLKHGWRDLHRHDFRLTTKQLWVHGTAFFRRMFRFNPAAHFRLAM